ncbi:MAG: hypothetical protein ACKOV8_04205 [Phycisphaerales bacterium]
MGRRRKREDAPLSLFSFQDIMACLTGILILVSLLLAIDGLSDTMQATPGKGTPAEPQDAARTAEELRQEIAVLTRTLEERKGGVDVAQGEVELLEDRERRMALEADRTRAVIEERDAELARLVRELESASQSSSALREQLSAAKAKADEQALRERVRFRPGAQYSKSPVFVETTPKGLVVGELDPSLVPRLVARLDDPGAENRLVGALGGRRPDTSYLVFVVRQDAIPRFEALRDAMIRKGFEVGWQLWDGGEGGFLDGAAAAAAGAAPTAPAAPGADAPGGTTP